MMTFIKYGFLLVALVCCMEAPAQKLRFERFSVENGLQNNIVFAVTQDARGLMWFATSTGIDRFDGNQFVHYPLPQRNNTYTAYVQVQHILADEQQQIWAASSSLVYLFNTKKDVFELPVLINGWLEKNKIITAMATGNGGKNLVIGVNNGVVIYDHHAQKIVSTEPLNRYVRSVYQDAKGLIWAGTNKGIRRFIVNAATISELSEEPPLLAPLQELAVTNISQDPYGRYWIVTAEKGIFIYDEAKQLVVQPVLPRSTSRSYAVKDVCHEKSQPVTCITLDGGGLLVLNQDLKVVMQYQTNEDDPATLSNNAAYDVFFDSYNRMWVTTYGGGVNMMIPSVQPFINFSHQINNNNSLSNNAAKAITEDRAGNLWLGTRKGISRYERTSQNWTHWNEDTKTPGFTGDNILAMCTAGENEIWAGVYGGGLMRVDTRTGKITGYLKNEADSQSIGTDYVYAVLSDSKGRTWAGGIRGPLSYYDRQLNQFVRINTPVSSVNCLVEDSKGQILAGTERGVYKVTGSKLENLFPDIVNERVLYILEYNPGKYWLGTLGNGIMVVSREKGLEKVFKSVDGLPSDVICGMVKDKSGDVWIGTSKGIAHYASSANSFTVYTKADGLAGSQVNYGAVYYTLHGEMIFGTTDGFSLFNPQSIQTKGYKPVIVLTGLHVNNKTVRAGEKDSPLDVQLDETERLALKYNQNSFTVEFVNTSPSTSGKHLYSWKLEGFDKEWSPPSTIPAAVYTNLNSGSYTLLIKAFDKGQAEDAQVRKLRIRIGVPWWRTGWAYAGYFLLLVAGTIAAYNYYTIRNARKKFAERLRLNTSISHEIRTPLTLIKGPVNALAGAEDISEEQRENIRLAQKNIQKLESILSQFIDFQKSGIDKLQMQVVQEDVLQLADDVVASFGPLMKEKNIHFTYKRPSGQQSLLYDRDKLEKVLNNLLSNAVKYTPPNRDIEVEVLTEAKYLVIHVKDTGIGIPQEQQQFLFKGYFRADNTVNLKETGSGIGLNVARELVELHHGKLSFVSRQGEGTTFTVKLPLQHPALQQYLVKSESEASPMPLPLTEKKTTAQPLNKTLVLAEDNDELRTYLEAQLVQSGYKVWAAADGKEAWELVQQHLPDIVVTDVMMPYLNGFQLCMNIKRTLATSHIPVIMLTAIHDKDYLLEGYRSGADDYVRKPFDLAYILVRMENLLLNRTRFRNKIMSVFEQEETGTAEDEDIAWLKATTAIIADNLGSPDFSVEKLSSLMAMSRPALFRKFKAITSESPQQYINQVRLRKAVELLQQRKLNISEVAFECGFADPKYFSTTFKKHYGQTPGEYMKAVKS